MLLLVKSVLLDISTKKKWKHLILILNIFTDDALEYIIALLLAHAHLKILFLTHIPCVLPILQGIHCVLPLGLDCVRRLHRAEIFPIIVFIGQSARSARKLK